ncbi:potassium channel family protein [Neosynechococcus sphagnicola]|uniref:potassium channel family protein n=1 Tax=Neosynechococcus sphagnicola TaxID=1501145 RepID=UPI000907D1DE|nr:potassium channel protein [Neosynechococcus sphagnicola]
MNRSLQRILIGTGFFLSTCIVAVMGYMVAGWPILDAIYMVVITIFGVGYGEVRPVTSPGLRVFTMFVIIAGTTSAVYIVGGFVQMVAEGEIHRAFDSRRVTRDIEALNQHVVICGFGRMGRMLARKMSEASQGFVIIDNDSDRIARAETMKYLAINGNATDDAVLQAAGIDRAKVLATVLPDDAANVFITLTARELNPDLMILARGEYPSTDRKLRLAGADHVVSPAAIGAERMAHLVTHPAALDLLSQADGRNTLNEMLAQIEVQVDELTIPSDSPLAGRTIGDVEIYGKSTFIVLALQRANGETMTHPDHGEVLQAGDTIIVMGQRGDMPKIVSRYALKRQMQYRENKRGDTVKVASAAPGERVASPIY